jgi:hypothetical protein
MSERGLAIIDDETLSEINDPTYEPSSESDSEYSSSDYDTDGFCYYCSAELEYEENEYYDEDANRFYCKRCFEHILEH